jgi:micrococcal nuclease
MYRYKAFVTRVIDGDTFIADVDLGFYLKMCCSDKIRFRILGIDAPEMKGKSRAEGEKSKEFLRGLIEGKEVEILTVKTDSFGRWLASVWINEDEIASIMLREGYAVPY